MDGKSGSLLITGFQCLLIACYLVRSDEQLLRAIMSKDFSGTHGSAPSSRESGLYNLSFLVQSTSNSKQCNKTEALDTTAAITITVYCNTRLQFSCSVKTNK